LRKVAFIRRIEQCDDFDGYLMVSKMIINFFLDFTTIKLREFVYKLVCSHHICGLCWVLGLHLLKDINVNENFGGRGNFGEYPDNIHFAKINFSE